MSFGAVAASVAGAAVGGMMSKGGGSGGGGGTVSKDPWAPAAPWLEDLLKQGQGLNGYYQQNPFNALQQTGYQNTFSDLDAFRGQNNGLMQFANQLMGSKYARQPQQSGLLGGQQQMGRPMGQQMSQQPQGLLSQGVFSIPQGQQYGQLNWRELNPYTATNGIPQKPVADPNAKTPEQIWLEEANARERDRLTNFGGA